MFNLTSNFHRFITDK